MDVTRASFQSSESLDRFYGDMAASDEPVSAVIGHQMLTLLSAMSRVPPQVRLYGFTSLSRLWLIAQDSPEAQLLLGVQALPTGYQFYRADGNSYVDAEAVHTADDVSMACSFLSTAVWASGSGGRAG